MMMIVMVKLLGEREAEAGVVKEELLRLEDGTEKLVELPGNLSLI
jgi:hypothetical protein